MMSDTALRCRACASWRSQFPYTVYAVAGTQADQPQRNKLVVMKMSSLCRSRRTEDDESDSDSDSDDDASSSGSDDLDDDPILEHQEIRHTGGFNRVRSMPQQSHVVASWSDTGRVSVWDISGQLRTLAEVSWVPVRRETVGW